MAGDPLARDVRIGFMLLEEPLVLADTCTALPVTKLPPAMAGGFMTSEGASVQTDPQNEQTVWMLAVRDRRDRDAFGRLFDYFGPRLKAMLMRSGMRDGSADDVVQDVMLAVWHKAAQFDPHRADASAWIYRIARNRQIDLVRRRPLPMPETVEEPEDTEPDPAQMLALEEEATLLRAAIARLTPEQGRVIQQAYIEDLTHSEISQISGLPLGTIKSRIRLGLERLRRELKDLTPR